MTKDDNDDDTIYTCWTVVWCMLDQGWSGTVNCKHSHHSFNWSQLIVPSIDLTFNWSFLKVFSKNNIWFHLKIPMANPNGMDYRFWQNPNLAKRSFSIYISSPLSSNARPTFRGLLVAGIQVRVNRKTNPKLCGQEIQSCNEGQILRWQFSTKPGFCGKRSCARQLFISPHNIFIDSIADSVFVKIGWVGKILRRLLRPLPRWCRIFWGPQLSDWCLKVPLFDWLALPCMWNH